MSTVKVRIMIDDKDFFEGEVDKKTFEWGLTNDLIDSPNFVGNILSSVKSISRSLF